MKKLLPLKGLDPDWILRQMNAHGSRFAFEWDVFGDRSLVMPQTTAQSRPWKRFVTWAIFGSKWSRMPA